jgi:hypothetical protein
VCVVCVCVCTGVCVYECACGMCVHDDEANTWGNTGWGRTKASLE